MHRLNMKLYLQSLFGIHMHSCINWLRPRHPSLLPSHLGSYTVQGRYHVNQDRRHLFGTPCICIQYRTYVITSYDSLNIVIIQLISTLIIQTAFRGLFHSYHKLCTARINIFTKHWESPTVPTRCTEMRLKEKKAFLCTLLEINKLLISLALQKIVDVQRSLPRHSDYHQLASHLVRVPNSKSGGHEFK